jgi:hypothetical protein
MNNDHLTDLYVKWQTEFNKGHYKNNATIKYNALSLFGNQEMS